MHAGEPEINSKRKVLDKDYVSVAKAVNRLFAQWQITDEQRMKLLVFTHVATKRQFENSPEKLTFSIEQKKRLSLLLNIDKGIRQLFANPNNICGFMTMVNHNSPFYGKTPIELACDGDKGLYLVNSAIDGMIAGGW